MEHGWSLQAVGHGIATEGIYQTAIKPDQETCGQCSPIEEAKRWLEATPEPQWQNSK
jgi:hypothetical protein